VVTEESFPDAGETKSDCYSSRERAAMVLWQRLRAMALSPLLDMLARCRVSADHLTLLSVLAGLAFCLLYFWSKPAAFALLAMHVLLDGLDGPLARHTGTASRRGSFVDCMSDQLVIVASTATLMSTKVIGILPGSVYIVAYTVLVLFAMIRNSLAIPYSWLIRPRFFVYIWLVVETYYLPGTIDYVLWFFNALMVLKLITGFAKIRRQL